MTFLERIRDTVVSVSHCCFEETFDDEADDYDDDDYDNEMEWYRTPEPAIFELFDPIVTMSLRVFDVRSPTSTPVIMRKKNSYKNIKRKKSDVTSSSAETAVSACVHMNKAINFDAMKKGLQQQVYGQCAGCAYDILGSSNNDLVCNDITKEDTGSYNLLYMSETTTTTIYVCLKCGCQGCGIKSRRSHALRHVNAAGSTTHALVMNTTTWMVCCIECKVEIPVVQSKRLVKCMKHLQKLARVSIVGSLKSRSVSLTRKFISWIGDVYTACSCKASIEVENQVAAHTASFPAASFKFYSSQERKVPSSQKVLGLRNVGNTCYFNAAMQALIQTYNLVKLLMERSIEGGPLLLPGRKYISDNSRTCSNDEDDYNMDLPSIRINLSQARPVTMALANFLEEINSATQTNIVNPSALFGQVCNEAPMFRGNQQHDSHELLSHMLGIMRSEEVKRNQVAVLKYFELSVNSDPQKVDHDLKIKVRNYGHQVNYTFVDALFGGCLISTVMCEECHYISQTVEPFQDLSLPVWEEKTCGIASLYNIVLVEGKKKGAEEKGDMVANKQGDIIHEDYKEEEDRKAYVKDIVSVEGEMDFKEEKGDQEADMKENIHPVEVEKEGDEEGDMGEDVMEDMVPVEGEMVGKDENVKNNMIPLEVEKDGKVEKDMKGYMLEEMVSVEWEKVAREEADVEEDMVPVEVEKEKERDDKGDSEEDVKECMDFSVVEKDVDVEKEGEMEADVMDNMVPAKWGKEIEEEGDREEDVKEEMIHAKGENQGKDEVDNEINLNEDIVPLQREYESMEEEGNIDEDVMEDLIPVEWEKEGEEEKGFSEDTFWVDIVPVVLEYVGEEEKGDREEDVRNYQVSVEGEMDVEEEKGDMKDLKEEIVPAEVEKEGKEFGDRDEDVKADIFPMEVDLVEDTREDIVHVESERKEEKEDMDEGVKEDMVSHEWEKKSKKEGGDMKEDVEDIKDLKEEKSLSDAYIEENMERDIIKDRHSLEASMTSDYGLVDSAEYGVEPSQSPVYISPHMSLSVLAEKKPTKDASVIYKLIPNGVAVLETEDTDGSGKESHGPNEQMYESEVTVHVEYMNGPVANGYLESGVTRSEEPMELESATSSILLSSSSYKHLGTGEQAISDVTSGTNTSSVIETCSSGFSQDLSLNMLYQSSEESEKVKDLDVPVNSSQSTVSDDTGISTQGTGSMDSATVENKEIPLKAGHDEDKSTSFNVQQMKPTEFENPQPFRSDKEIWREGQRKSIWTLAPRYHSTSSECTIESCLNLFTSSEPLTGNNKFGCKNCTKLKKKLNPNAEIKTVYSDATKKYLIIQPPAVLILHLKRFEQLEITKINKLDCHVDFPFVLDLAPYCSALCENVKPGQKKILYSLYGVVEHKGDLRYGHYTAYVKVRPSVTSQASFLSTHHVSVKEYLNQYTDNVLRMGENMEKETEEDNVNEILVPPGQWFHISDTHVSKVTESTVKQAQAYMLFYERIF